MRDPWLDNIKYVLITFVVVGHTLPLVATGTDLHAQVYDFIYFWHIPAFVLVTGHLSRSFTFSRRHLSALVTGLLIPYLVFESAMRFVVRQWTDTPPEDPYLLNPGWPMWYLVATMLWRLATPVLRSHWAALPASVAASLWFGAVDADWTDWLDLSRVVGFLPFFTLGLWLDRERLQWFRTRYAAWAGAVVLAGVFVLSRFTDDWIATRWLWYSYPYSALRADGAFVDDAQGALLRLGVMAVGLVATFAVISLVPRGRHWFTPLGAATLVVYLFHGFVVRLVDRLGFPDWAAEQGDWIIAASALGAVAVAAVLAHPVVSDRLMWLVDPISTRRARARARASRDATTPA